MREATADRVQTLMLNEGPKWYTELESGAVPTARGISKENISALRTRLAPLAQHEAAFLDKFCQEKLYVTHATSSHADIDKPDGTVSLFSRKKLAERTMEFNEDNTEQQDIDNLKNDDNVFFSLEAGETPQKPQSRFGDRLLRFDFDQPRVQQHATLHLVDPLTGDLPMVEGRFPAIEEHHDADAAAAAIQGLDLEREFIPPANGLFQAEDMKPGLALAIIDACRKNMPSDMAKELLSSTKPNDLINGLFRPTVMVPRHFFDKPVDEAAILLA